MKKLILITLTILRINALAQCGTGDYVNPVSLPASLVLFSGDTLAISQDVNYENVSITVMSGGAINICNGAQFNIQGSLTIFEGGLINVFDCGTYINVEGSYFDAYQTYQIDLYCKDCYKDELLTVNGSQFGGEVNCVNPLPVELISYSCNTKGVYWVTASEVNSSHFIVETSNDGVKWIELDYIYAMGNTTELTYYNYEGTKDTYTRVVQYDIDGTSETFDILLCGDNQKEEVKVLYYTDASGRIVNKDSRGFKIAVYSDGTTKKILN